MRFMVVTPTAAIKQYCDVLWSDSIKEQTHTDFRHFVVDSSAGAAYVTRLRSLLPNSTVVRRAALAGTGVDNILLQVHKEARSEFLTGVATDCDVYLSWESDVIDPGRTALAKANAIMSNPDLNIGILVCEYPDRMNPRITQGGLGFTAIRRSVMESLAWDARGGYGQVDNEDDTHHSLDGWLLRRAVRAGVCRLVATNLVTFTHPDG